MADRTCPGSPGGAGPRAVTYARWSSRSLACVAPKVAIVRANCSLTIAAWRSASIVAAFSL